MVRIRLKRLGAKKRPYYRVVVMDARTAHNGKTIEKLGLYHPIGTGEVKIQIDEARYEFWIKRGAQPSTIVRKLLLRQRRREESEEMSIS